MQVKITLLSTLAILCVTTVLLTGCTGQDSGIPPTPTPPVPGEVYLFDQTNDGQTYDVPVDAGIRLKLPENPTTGYSWQLSVTQGLVIVNESYQPDDPTGKLIGSGGTHLWIMRAVQPGMQTVSGVYSRPWESAAGNQTSFTLNLLVGGGSVPTGVPPGFTVYTEKDNGRTVQEGLARQFDIRLAENPTTGYSWNLSLSEGLSLIHDEYIPSSGPEQRPGAGGIRSFSLRAEERGEQTVHSEYRRPWVPAGTITYIDLEGGFYGIAGDDGNEYLPLNLDQQYHTDGLRVAFEYEPGKDIATIQMWGTPVNLTFIEKIDLYDLTVFVP
jgi:inhibitor of cysteine peptidase